MKRRWRPTGSFAWHPWDDGKLAIVHFADQSYSVNPIIRHDEVTKKWRKQIRQFAWLAPSVGTSSRGNCQILHAVLHQPAFDPQNQDLLLLNAARGFENRFEAYEEPVRRLDGVRQNLHGC